MTRKIIIILILIVLACAALAFAGFMYVTGTTSKYIEKGRASVGGSYSNTLPMFGSDSYEEYVANRSKSQEEADEKLIAAATGVKSKEESAKDAIRLGQDSVGQKDYDTAMKRFNQAWLLDHENFNVFWGYAELYTEMGSYQESAKYFDMAIQNYSEDKAVIENGYLPLWYDASRTYVSLAYASQLSNDTAKAKLYSQKSIELLSKTLAEKGKIPSNQIPGITLLLAIAYEGNGDYSQSRLTLDGLLRSNPEFKTDASIVGLDRELKGKGF